MGTWSFLDAGIESQRQRYRDELLDALRAVSGEPLAFDEWVRVVTLRYADDPLAAVGSLKDVGGRFNIGIDCAGAREQGPCEDARAGRSRPAA